MKIPVTEAWWNAAIVSSAVIVIALTAGCLSQGITTVFMYLYYIPIVLIAYHYRKKGMLPCILLGLAYLALVIMHDPANPVTREGALIQVIVFIAIAVLVAYLAQNIVTTGDNLKSVADIQQGIVQNANVWLMVLDKDGRIREWNHAAETISGYPADTVMGKNTIWKLLYPEEKYRKEITGKIAEIIAQRNYLVNLRTTITRNDGTHKTILWNTRDLPGNPGESPRYIAIGVDITERTDAETALKESEAKYRTLFENLLEGLAYCRMIYDDHGRPVDWMYLTVNRSFERLTGLNDVEGKRVLEVIPDIRTLNPELFDTYGRVAATGIPETFEIYFKPLNTWMKISAFSPEKGYFVAVFDDITEHKHTEDTVRDARDFYLLILNDFPNPVWRADVSGKCDYFNKNWLAFTGRTIGQELGDGWAEGVHPDDLDRSLKIYLDHFNARTPFEMEYRLRYHDGTYHWLLDFGKPLFTKDGTFSGYIGSCYDIHDRKMADAALRESEEKYRTLIEKANEAVIIAQDGNFAFANPSMSRLLGVPADELTGKPFVDFIWPDDRDLVTTRYRKRMAGVDIPETYDFRVIGAGGRMKWVFISAAQILWQGRPATLNLLTDVTERKRAEEDLTLEKQRMESLLSLSQRGQRAEKEIISTVVEDAIRLTGSTIGYLATMNDDESVMTMQYWSKTTYESCRIINQPIEYPLEKTGLWGEAVRQRKPIVTNDYAAESPFKRGTPEGHVSLVRHMNIPVFEGDHIVAIAGVGNKGADYNEGDVRQLQLLMQGWWQIVVRRQAEAALQESEERFRQFFNNINDALYLHALGEQGLPGKFIEVNDVMCNRLGYTRDELLQRAPQDIVSDAGRAKMPAIAEEMAGKGHATFETEHRRKDGSIIPVEVSTVIFSLAGTRVAMASARDITERKRAKEALTQSEERYRTLAEASPDQIFINDRNGTILYANTTALKLLGLPYDQVIGKQRGEFFPPEIIGDQNAAFENVFDTGDSLRQEARIHFGEREEWIDTTLVPLKDAAGHIYAVLGVARDITERKRMEESLRESRQLFSDIISFLPDPTWVIDHRGNVLAWNRALEQISGIPAEDMLGKGDFEYSLWQYGNRRPTLINLVQDPDQDAARMNYRNIRHEGSSVMAETQVTLPSGKSAVLSLVASPLYDAKGSITGAIESMRDITRIKETEAELARLNENLESIILERTRALQEEVVQRQRAEKDVQAALDYTRSVIEANPDLMVILDFEGKILDINTAGETLTGIPKDQLIGTPYFRYLVDDGTLYTAFSQHLETGWTEKVIRIRRTDGHTTPLSVHATMIKGTGTTPDRIIVSAHDITRQKQDEAAIQASLDEKVLLLREIHHRVKNNLQIIISLTNLQMRTMDDPKMKQAMAETRNRVRAMSLVHEKLYQSEDISSIDLAEYTRFLATQLFSFYGIDHRRVSLETDIGKIPLDINIAIPLGLIMNELISNSLKHAFPDNMSGTLRITGRSDGDTFTLSVRDNGTGLPPDFDWKNTESLGLRLITSLVDQLGGTIERKTGSGTEFQITIPLKAE
ncbi:PAS domain S-box protein [Methanoregula sp.]|uniref:PAS domain S-box protein n=1 Tax=Methanoregula sp. TaxID=2052170 RepID=UPI002370C912|nr:PAS domain S-box protein [Methanoregula sp.]MDD1685865.1 PAS domain S-box protein [Methanoregula sp.]